MQVKTTLENPIYGRIRWPVLIIHSFCTKNYFQMKMKPKVSLSRCISYKKNVTLTKCIMQYKILMLYGNH